MRSGSQQPISYRPALPGPNPGARRGGGYERLFALAAGTLLLASCATPSPTVGVTTYIRDSRLQGSGVVIHEDARGTWVLTAGHVVSSHNPQQSWPSAEFYVQTPTGTHAAERVAAFIGSTDLGNCDLGLLRTVRLDLPEAVVGDERTGALEVRAWRYGESVLPASLDDRRLSTRPDIAAGDSGAAVYSDGRLVGIVTAEAAGDGVFVRLRVVSAFLSERGFGGLLE